MWSRLNGLLGISRSRGIARRYFVVNGFDGALTMLGLMMGFHVSQSVATSVVANACFGAAVALAVSGISSAYLSETAEKRKELRELERAMITDLGESAHGRAARLLPLVIGLINGLAPLLISLVIIAPLWLVPQDVDWPLAPLSASMANALVMIFLLGVFLGRVSGTFWLWSGLRTLAIAVLTTGLIWLLNPAA